MKSMNSSSFVGRRPRICVPVMAHDTVDALKIMNELAADPMCEIIEWRLDALADPMAFDKIQTVLSSLEGTLDTSILLTMRTKNEGGIYPIEKDALHQYYMALADMDGVDGIDIQYRDVKTGIGIVDAIQKKGKAVILSWHDFHKTPQKNEIKSLAHDMEKSACDVVKMAFMPVDTADVDSVKAAGAELKNEIKSAGLVLISMGALGTEVRIKAAQIGSCFTFGCRPGEESAPGQIEYHELKKMMEEY